MSEDLEQTPEAYSQGPLDQMPFPLDQGFEASPADSGEGHEMSFFEHLGELRRALVITAIAVILGTVLGFAGHKQVLSLLMAQIQNVPFVIISPAEGFTAVLRLSLFTGLFLGFPVALREAIWFIGPALTRRQRFTLIPIAIISYVLLVVGMLFAYYLLLPLGVKFLIGFVPEGITPNISIDRYIGFASALIFSTGLIFQVPIVMLLLSLFGVVQRMQLAPQRRYAVLISFIVAAVITPSVDMLTQTMLATTLILLFEVGLLFMWLAEKLRPKAQY